ncbi:MAG TPA: MBL fold metallo-hydrolase [Planctomycetota bacterium]|nr:MBL fold metallo-hydrolase [Planctomycetota bacterium]
MKLQWLGHSCFLITAADGTRILTDPYDVKSYAGALSYKDLDGLKADIVTVSHMTHPDHNHLDAIGGPRRVVKKAGDHVIGNIRITGVTSFHDEAKGSERGMNIIFIISVDDIRICHLGDLGHVLTEGNARGMGKVDVLLVPVGGTYTIDSGQADTVVNIVKPSIAIPMHYKTDRCGFPIDAVGPFLAEKQNVKHLKSEVTISRETLPQETETWVLEYTK